MRASARRTSTISIRIWIKIVFAGPLLSDDGETSVGGLIVMDCPDLQTAKAFAHGDPYAVGGLFVNVEVRPWRKVIPA